MNISYIDFVPKRQKQYTYYLPKELKQQISSLEGSS
jgi:hypothetical protein